MKNLNLFAVWAVTILSALTLQATTYYVSVDGGDDGNPGTSKQLPKKNIQAAIDLCAAGDTVLVMPGDYTYVEGVCKKPASTADSFSFAMPCVVYMDKKITLKSTGGKDVTFITGAYGNGKSLDGNSAYDWPETGQGAVRCIYGVNATGSVIEGFTLRKGSTVRAKTNVNNYIDLVGGIHFVNGTGYMVDCDVTDCRAGDGAAVGRDVRSIRCRFLRNKSKNPRHVTYRTSYHYNCLFADNGDGTGALMTGVQSYKMVNCTFIGNKVANVANNNSTCIISAYNCAFLDKPASAGLAQLVADGCVQGVAGGANILNVTNVCVKGNVVGGGNVQYISPYDGDWRALKGATILDRGADIYNTVEYTGARAEDLSVDFAGNERVMGDSIDAGCFETKDPQVASVMFSRIAPGTVVEGFGLTLTEFDGNGLWRAIGDGKPGQLRIGYDKTKIDDIFGYYVVSDILQTRFPDNKGDGGCWYMVGTGTVYSLDVEAFPRATGKDSVVWVDDNADPAVADGSEAKPFQRLMDGVAAVQQRGVVKVKPGVYDKGVDAGNIHGHTEYDGGTCRLSLWKSIIVEAVEGPGKTFIKGGSDVASIVRPSNRNQFAQVKGFTLTGAQSTQLGAAFFANVSGNSSSPWAVMNYSEEPHVTDCVISNNVGLSAVRGGWFERCLFIDNFTTEENMKKGTSGTRGTVANTAILSSCIITYSPQYFEKGGYPAVCMAASHTSVQLDCTFDAPRYDAAGNTYRLASFSGNAIVCYNNAFARGYNDPIQAVLSTVQVGGGNVQIDGNTSRPWWLNPVGESDFFADYMHDNYYPIKPSPHLDKGVSVPSEYARYMVGDKDSMAFDLRGEDGGAPIPGAYQTLIKVLQVLLDSKRGTVDPSSNQLIEGGKVVTFTAEPTKRAFLGWIVNGVTNLTSVKTCIYTMDESLENPTIEPLFSHCFYIDAVHGDDANDGYTPATPQRQVGKGRDNLTVAGDELHAAPGDYSTGYNRQDSGVIFGAAGKLGEDQAMFSRVVLRPGMKLIADQGPDVTFITGTLGKTTGDRQGPDAIRCVAACENSLVKGFTIRGGATHALTGNEYDNCCGGGVLTYMYNNANGTATIEDCVFSNNWARTGAHTWGGKLVRCRMMPPGSASAASTCAKYSKIVNCSIWCDQNAAIGYHHGIYSSTIFCTGSSAAPDMNAINDTVPVENSIILAECTGLDAAGTTAYPPVVLKNWRSSIWYDSESYFSNAKSPWRGQKMYSLDPATCENVIVTKRMDGTDRRTMIGISVDPADMLKPYSDSVVIDRGDSSLVPHLEPDEATDVVGTPRVLNRNAIDLGAYEYDWRVDYARAIFGRKMSFGMCSADLALEGEGLRVPAGSYFDVEWRPGYVGEVATFEIAEIGDKGEVIVYRNGETKPYKTIQVPGVVKLEALGRETDLRIVASGNDVKIAKLYAESVNSIILFQ